MKKYQVAILLSIALLSFGCTSDKKKSTFILSERYKGLCLIDIHNHDAARYHESKKIWDKYNVSKVVLFGNISEPSAMDTDRMAMKAYKEMPDRVIPFISGINLHDKNCLEYIRGEFKKGVFGIGEIVAVSLYSPMAGKLLWKGNGALDGYFPEIYELCAEYKKPVLLHIDPPSREYMDQLVQAANEHPHTRIIWAHANAYTDPLFLESILQKTDNIYIDFFSGFTAFNPDSKYGLDDFVPVIKKYQKRFMVSTDSGYGIGYENAYIAIYKLFDLLDLDTIERIAHLNFEELFIQPET